MSNPRIGKVADRIHQIIASRLEKGLRDPRLGFVTITDVRVTGDLQQASVFYTVYGSDEDRVNSAKALKAATGMLRSEVAKNLGTRLTPTIEFIPDELPETAEHLSELLKEAKQRDAELRAQAKNAEYAGDADPYGRLSGDEATADDAAAESLSGGETAASDDAMDGADLSGDETTARDAVESLSGGETTTSGGETPAGEADCAHPAGS
ncbi:30S ribosome-binding factor RbfA [Canibacter sp. lx-72]|nr:30S ribosome-binding factor RbfA [Canibacter zhuwentaonis]